jgi:hypothetical protein
VCALLLLSILTASIADIDILLSLVLNVVGILKSSFPPPPPATEEEFDCGT